MIWLLALLLVAIGLGIGYLVARAGSSRHLTPEEWERLWREDAQNLRVWSEQFNGAVDDLIAIVESSSQDPMVVPTPEERAAAHGAWCRIADVGIGIHRRTAAHRDFILLWSGGSRRRDRIRGFLFCDAADLMIQDAALRVSDAVAGNPKWAKILNEPEPSLGLEKNSYDYLRDQVHNPERFARQFAAAGYLAFLGTLKDFDITDQDPDAGWLLAECDRLHAQVTESYRRDGITYAIRQTKDFSGGIAFRAWFPVQKGVANTMGNIRLRREGHYLIEPDQARELRQKLQPGDIGVTRKSWYLSNAGIPGFWPHAILHLGTREELEAFFDDEEVIAWCRLVDSEADSLTKLLARRHPEAWSRYVTGIKVHEADANGIKSEVGNDEALFEKTFIEAIAPGVVFRLTEETLAADFCAFLRPRLPKRDLAVAIERAFSHAGKPYDYNFDFTTSSSLVCSELVYKSYQGDDEQSGLHLPLDSTLGRPVLPPTNIVRLFDEQFDSPDRQLDFVLFMDARESELRAFEEDIETFRESWKRPKWYAFAN